MIEFRKKKKLPHSNTENYSHSFPRAFPSNRKTTDSNLQRIEKVEEPESYKLRPATTEITERRLKSIPARSLGCNRRRRGEQTSPTSAKRRRPHRRPTGLSRSTKNRHCSPPSPSAPQGYFASGLRVGWKQTSVDRSSNASEKIRFRTHSGGIQP